QRANLCRPVRVIGLAASLAVRHSGHEFIAPPVPCGRLGACRILPFGLGQQTIGALSEPTQPSDVLLRILPTQVVDRLVVVPERLIRACQSVDAETPFTVGHRETSEREWRHCNPMSGSLSGIFLASHVEAPARQAYQLGTFRTVTEGLSRACGRWSFHHARR